MSIISVKNLKKSYKSSEVLKGVEFQIAEGSVYALLGSNGAGKTTTVNILATLLSMDEGTVTIAGYDARKQAKEVRKHISLTGQFAAVDDLLTGRENMYMMGILSRVPYEKVKARTAALLRQFDLEKAADKRVSAYSGGMRRKLDLAISLLASPSVIFLDEPTTGLDPRSRQELWHVIRDLSRAGTTILLTTQYLEEADALADTIGVLHDGRIVAEGTADELKRHIGGEYVDLTFKDASDYAKAQSVLKNAETTDGSLRLTVPVARKVKDLRAVLAALDAVRIEPEELAIRKPTLDDVFMQLTDTSKGDK